ncbi:MAG TPA: hypothetical protein VII06_30770 [Chloroflexota bacterium]|jgi:hypothetical protein
MLELDDLQHSLEYAEYPQVTADEIKKALKIKEALGEMLDQMQ